MQEITPNYYDKFRCIADRCSHSCCIGWEIEIDEETAERYRTMDTPLGERIQKSIEGDPPHFILGEEERCPFLNKKGLCDIICECGEKALCDICALHPRFRNFFASFTETGLGLCCEEAARIILAEKEPFRIPAPKECSEEESFFLTGRQRVFEILQDREKTIRQRFSTLAELFSSSFAFSLDKLRKIYLSLERLDNSWTELLKDLDGFAFDGKIFMEEEFQIPLEQLAVYFVFRHFADGFWNGDYTARIQFTLMSCYLIGALWEKFRQDHGTIAMENMADLVRMYSAEVEYSEENLNRLRII